MAVQLVRGGLIHVKVVVAAGHHHRQAVGLGPALDAGAGDPVPVIAQQPVQQVQRGKFALRPVGAALACKLVHRKDHIQSDLMHQRLGDIIDLQQCHNKTPRPGSRAGAKRRPAVLPYFVSVHTIAQTGRRCKVFCAGQGRTLPPLLFPAAFQVQPQRSGQGDTHGQDKRRHPGVGDALPYGGPVQWLRHKSPAPFPSGPPGQSCRAAGRFSRTMRRQLRQVAAK